MIMHKGKILLLAACAIPTFAFAEIKVNGFASVGGGIYSEDKGSYGGVNDTFTTDPYTRVGLQFSTEINDKTSFTGQFMARGSDDYNVEAEWLYLTYDASDSTDIRIGRLRSPFFYYSDFLEVGYAYPWITPPAEVYRFLFTTLEGVDVVNQHNLGDWSGTFQAYYGGLTDDTRLQGEDVLLTLDDFAGVNYSLNYDWLTLRASYNIAEYSIGTPSSLSGLYSAMNQVDFGLEQFGFTSDMEQLVDVLEVSEEEGVFWGLAANVDYNDWLVTAEYTVLDVGDQSVISSDTAWYLMLGKRVGDFTFTATYSEVKEDTDYSVLALIPDPEDPTFAAIEAGTRAALQADLADEQSNVETIEDLATLQAFEETIGGLDVIASTIENDLVNEEQTTTNVILGMRWDYRANSAFKVEVNQVDRKIGDGGTLVSFAIDVIF